MSNMASSSFSSSTATDVDFTGVDPNAFFNSAFDFHLGTESSLDGFLPFAVNADEDWETFLNSDMTRDSDVSPSSSSPTTLAATTPATSFFSTPSPSPPTEVRRYTTPEVTMPGQHPPSPPKFVNPAALSLDAPQRGSSSPPSASLPSLASPMPATHSPPAPRPQHRTLPPQFAPGPAPLPQPHRAPCMPRSQPRPPRERPIGMTNYNTLPVSFAGFATEQTPQFCPDAGRVQLQLTGHEYHEQKMSRNLRMVPVPRNWQNWDSVRP